ncbi:MAG: thiamine phosphate synthase [Oceanicaulis sp.]
MEQGRYDALARLASRADALAPGVRRTPGLLVLTDPGRTPDPAILARRLAPGTGLILRTFGEPRIEAAAFEIADIARARALTLLISADPALARRCGAHGVHWPQWSAPRQPWPGALTTASVHDPAALRRAQGRVNAVLISTVFASDSPSAGRPMGPFRLAAWARRSGVPVYALGGVSLATVGRLQGLGVAGVAAVGAAARIPAG